MTLISAPAGYGKTTLLGCQINGFQCLPIRNATFKEQTAAGEYVFLAEFNKPDGSLFIQRPCCGEGATTSSATFQFEFRVFLDDSGQFRVLDLPVYIP